MQDEEYSIAWKSIEAGRVDYVNAIAEGKTEFPGFIGFKTPTMPMASQPADKEAEKQVNLVGGIAGQTDQLIAFALKEDEKGNEIEQEIGVLNLVSYAKVRNKVILVPVNGAAVLPKVKQEINTVFAQSVAEWDVVIDAGYTVDPAVLADLDAGESGMLASFPKNMRDFIQAFKSERDEDKNAYYLFIIPGKQGTRAGFMPFKRQYGFIYPANTNNTARTIAHELAHGAFRLRHTFSPEEFIAGQGSTNNLMDYPAGPELRKYQWDNVHEPESMNGWFEDDAEVAMVSNSIDSYWKKTAADISRQTGREVFGVMYCKECETDSEPFVETKITLEKRVIGYESNKCFLSIFYVDEHGKFLENSDFKNLTYNSINSGDNSESAHITLMTMNRYKDGQALIAIGGDNPSDRKAWVEYPCTNYIEEKIASINFCDKGYKETDDFLNSIFGSIKTCLEESGTIVPADNPITGDIPVARIINQKTSNEIAKTLSNKLRDDELFKLVFSSGDEKEILETQLGANAQYTIFVEIQPTGKSIMRLEVSKEYLSSLQLNDSEINELLGYLDELFQQAQVSFCDAPGPNCSKEALNYLQVINLHFQNLADAGVMHPASWDGKDSKNGLIPSHFKVPAAVGGAIDAVAEEVTSVPVLLKTVGEVISDDELKDAFLGVFSEEGWQQVKEGIFSSIVETIKEEDKREYNISKASVSLLIGYYILISKTIGSVSDAMKKVGDLATKIERTPNVQIYLKKIVKDYPSEAKALKLQKLLDNISSDDLEKLISRLPVNKIDDLIADLSDDVPLAKLMASKPELVNAWRKMFDLGDAIPNAIRKNPDVLSKTQNWSDDLYNKLGAVKDKNPGFFDQVNDNPAILEFFEEGSSIISNKADNLKAVELDMYSLDRARESGNSLFEPGTTKYIKNTTGKDLTNMDINPQSGKIRDANGNILNTDNVNGEGLMYVIDESDNKIIGGRGGIENSFPHPTLIGGTNPNVKSAGMIRFKDGRILEINNNSGHFKPSNSVLQEAEQIFRRKMPSNSFDSNFVRNAF